jgi:hypothetical protein
MGVPNTLVQIIFAETDTDFISVPLTVKKKFLNNGFVVLWTTLNLPKISSDLHLQPKTL